MQQGAISMAEQANAAVAMPKPKLSIVEEFVAGAKKGYCSMRVTTDLMRLS